RGAAGQGPRRGGREAARSVGASLDERSASDAQKGRRSPKSSGKFPVRRIEADGRIEYLVLVDGVQHNIWAVALGRRGNPVRIRNCPAAVIGNERRESH